MSSKITARDLVSREVIQNVSYLVSTLAGGYECFEVAPVASKWENMARNNLAPLKELSEQAFELASPVDDWEEAAIQEGWKGPFQDDFGATYWRDRRDGMTWTAKDWRDLCGDHDIEPYAREVYEHWAVSPWLADELLKQGEKVDKDFAGMCVWARTTTGQAIYADYVIEEIHAELVGA